MTARVAIVGAGPGGLFVAQALLKLLPGAEIDVIDRLPVPYGLVRYGVAPDHQGTKAVIRQFERLFERQGVAFFGGVTLGRDIALDALRALYDAVVLSTGLPTDRRLGIPGEDLPGVQGAGAVTRHWSSHPDAPPPAIGTRVVVLGMGNVAADVVRILSKTPDEFDGSDLCPDRAAALAAAGVVSIDVVARGPAGSVRVDPVMLRELGRLSAVRIRVDGLPGDGGKLAEAFAAIDGHAPAGARRMLTFRFGWTPERITGTDAPNGVAFGATDGSGRAMGLPCDTVITAIGFDEDPAQPRGALLATADADGRLGDGLYAAGWFRRGPRGTIPENRADAQIVATRIAADLAEAPGDRPGRAALSARLPQAVPYDGWLRIDAAERAEAPEGRCRRKVDTLARMFTLARTEGARP